MCSWLGEAQMAACGGHGHQHLVHQGWYRDMTAGER